MKITFTIDELVPRFIMADKNGYAVAKAIEKAFQYVAGAAEDGLDIILDVENMPEWRLDELAVDYNVPYDYEAGIEQKRKWIREAIPMYQILGTKEAVRQYIDGYFGEVEINENWEYGGEPYHFTVTVGGEWTPRTEAWARGAIERVISIRSVLDALRPGCRCAMAILATGEVLDRIRYPFAGELTTGEYPTENHLYLIDKTLQALDVRGENSVIVYDMAGEKPEINTLFVPDNTGDTGDETGDAAVTIYYPQCGDVICGE